VTRRHLAVLVGLVLSAVALRARHLPIRPYDGRRTGANNVNRIVRDSRGFLWFYGRRTVAIRRLYVHELRTQGFCERHRPSENAGDWVATEGGLVRFDRRAGRILRWLTTTARGRAPVHRGPA
jgi:streptogramin lyase